MDYLKTFSTAQKILWHAHPLLGKDGEVRKYKKDVAK
jgi:hypothetical protein